MELADRLKTHVEELCKIPRYSSNFPGMMEAADYIKDVWFEIGLDDRIDEQCFHARIPGSDTMIPCENIITSIGPEDAERIIMGAHYDTDGVFDNDDDPSETEIINGVHYRKNPGADDNASAVAGLLETARELKALEEKFFEKNIRVDFVAFANEECPYHKTEYMGSYVHAKSLSDESVNVKEMICYEMIGYFDDEPYSQKNMKTMFGYHAGEISLSTKLFNVVLKHIYPNTGNFIGLVGNWKSRKLVSRVKKTMKANADIDVRTISISHNLIPAIGFSDNWSYWQYDYPAIMVTDTSFLRNPNYHSASDTPDTLDYSRMAEVVKGVTAYVKSQIGV